MGRTAKDIVIVDIDGTVADVGHRLHHIQGPKRKNWKKFFEAMHRDEPIPEVIDRVREMAATSEIVLVTGRPANYEGVTRQWLQRHEIPFDRLLMRRAGDHRADFVAKEDLLRELPIERVVLAIDDRAPVCEMYRRHGIEVWEIESDTANQKVNEAYRQHPE
jgi:uncharacterized HAD superfamily protein